MNKLILALTAALVAGSAMAADAPTKPTSTPGVEKAAAAPNTAIKAHHHLAAQHHRAGKHAHRKHAA